MKTNLIILLLLISGLSNAQILISDDPQEDGNANTNAILELKSISQNKGMLLPRVSLVGLNQSAPLSSHVKGMIVYNATTSGTGTAQVSKGLYYNDGTKWSKISTEIPSIGDIKFSSETTDHEGWYLLDGRQVSSLPSVSVSNAVSLGFTTNLPDATDRFIKAGTGQGLGEYGGNSQITINQANLPNVTFSGQTNNAGSHWHTFLDRGTGAVISGEQPGVAVFDDGIPQTKSTSAAGSHSHSFTIETGGSSEPIEFVPQYLAASAFVYLGY